MGAIWTIIKVFFYSACGNKEHPGNLQNKPVSSPFNWVSRYILFLAKLKRRGRSFLEGARRTRAALWVYPQEQLVVIRDEKVCAFVKFEIIVPLLFYLLDPLTNKHCRTWSSMINLWIDSGPVKSTESCCQQGKGLRNYLELSKENVLGNIMLSHWPEFIWNFFMIWFHETLELTFKKQASRPRNTCTEHWRKPPIFTAFLEIFLYLKNNDSYKKFCYLCYSYISKVKQVFSLHLVGLVVSDFYFDYVPLFYFLIF